MSLIDTILNLACLLLWLNWRSLGLAGKARSTPISLAATLKSTAPGPAGRWISLLGLLALLAARSFFYWQIGSEVNWTPQLQLGVVVLPFRSDFLGRIALFSLLSFGQVLLGFYIWLFLLSAINRDIAEKDPFQKMVQMHLGWFARWPAAVKLILPWALGAGVWAALNPAFVRIGLLLPPPSWTYLGQQAIIVGASTFLVWKLLILGALLLHVLNAYVFLGDFPFWGFVNTTARNLLRPLRWLPLRLGRVDLAPALGMALVVALSEFAVPGLTQLYQRISMGP